MKNKILDISFKGLLILLSIIFVLAGLDKVLCRPDAVNAFQQMGIPKTLMILTGFSEIILGCLLHVRYFTKLALQGLMFILTIGFIMTIVSQGFLSSIFPLAMIFLCLFTHHLGQISVNNKN